MCDFVGMSISNKKNDQRGSCCKYSSVAQQLKLLWYNWLRVRLCLFCPMSWWNIKQNAQCLRSCVILWYYWLVISSKVWYRCKVASVCFTHGWLKMVTSQSQLRWWFINDLFTYGPINCTTIFINSTWWIFDNWTNSELPLKNLLRSCITDRIYSHIKR